MRTIYSILFLLVSFPCISQVHYVEKMNTLQIDSLDKEKTIVLIPGGILEEHGPYLPSFADGYLNEALTRELASYITKKPGWQVLVFPMIPLGNSGANDIGRKFSFPGTYAIKQNTLRTILIDLGTELGDQGFKNIFIIHMHGAPNHNLAIDQASAYFNDMYKGKMINIWNLAFDAPQDFKNEKEKQADGFSIHAGMDETSVVYYLKPEFLYMKKTEAITLTASGPDSMVTIARKEEWPGYFGAPSHANLQHGEKTWKAWVSHITNQAGQILDGSYNFSKPSFFQVVSNIPAYKSIIEDEKIMEKKLEEKQEAWLKKNGYE